MMWNNNVLKQIFNKSKKENLRFLIGSLQKIPTIKDDLEYCQREGISRVLVSYELVRRPNDTYYFNVSYKMNQKPSEIHLNSKDYKDIPDAMEKLKSQTIEWERREDMENEK